MNCYTPCPFCLTVQSNIERLQQTSSGPDQYSLSWAVSTVSSVSKFRVYHDGERQGDTLFTNFTVEGLQPCRRYTARVEALCGQGTLMNSRTVPVHTGMFSLLS